MAESLKNKIFKGVVWSSIERFSVQGVMFTVMIVMARVLTPKEYGLVGMMTIFIAVSQSLMDSGFSQALIRKRERSQTDCSTVFYFNIVVGGILYMLLFVSAPLIARFYDEPQLIPIARVISLSIPLNSLLLVQKALLTADLDFRTQAKASGCGAVLSGAIGIWMAYSGWGVWSIVWFQISNLVICAVLLWCMSRWRPSLEFSWCSYREFFGFGSKLAVAGLLDTLYQNINLIVIGKVFNAYDLGLYTRAQQFATFPSSNITSVFQRVTFPMLCSINNDEECLRIVYSKFLRLTAFVIFPLMIGLGAVSHPLILLVLKEQWAFSAVLLQILCLAMMWYPVHAMNLNLLQVVGRTDLFLKLEVIKKCIGITILAVSIPFGIVAICWGAVLTSIASLVINTHYTGRLIGLGFWKQMHNLVPSLLYSFSMGIVVMAVINIMTGATWLRLAAGIVSGIIYFITITKLTGSDDMVNLCAFIRRKPLGSF